MFHCCHHPTLMAQAWLGQWHLLALQGFLGPHLFHWCHLDLELQASLSPPGVGRCSVRRLHVNPDPWDPAPDPHRLTTCPGKPGDPCGP